MANETIPRAEADAMVAAAYEAAASEIDCGCKHRDTVLSAIRAERWKYCGDPCAALDAKDIRALTPDDARAALDQMISDAVNEATKLTVPIAALDKMLAEAEKRGMLRAAEVAEGHGGDMLGDWKRGYSAAVKDIDAAIRAEAGD